MATLTKPRIRCDIPNQRWALDVPSVVGATRYYFPTWRYAMIGCSDWYSMQKQAR